MYETEYFIEQYLTHTDFELGKVAVGHDANLQLCLFLSC